MKISEENKRPQPEWEDDVEMEVYHFNFTDINEESFYVLYIEDSSQKEAWISTDSFCPLNENL